MSASADRVAASTIAILLGDPTLARGAVWIFSAARIGNNVNPVLKLIATALRAVGPFRRLQSSSAGRTFQFEAERERNERHQPNGKQENERPDSDALGYVDIH